MKKLLLFFLFSLVFTSIGSNSQNLIPASVADALVAVSSASMTNGGNNSSSSQRSGNSSNRNSAQRIVGGIFYYNGAGYEFSLKFYYNPSTRKISSIYYAPKATGKYSKIQGEWYVSSERIYINGKTADGVRTEISAEEGPRGYLWGDMRRGTHYGECTIYM